MCTTRRLERMQNPRLLQYLTDSVEIAKGSLQSQAPQRRRPAPSMQHQSSAQQLQPLHPAQRAPIQNLWHQRTSTPSPMPHQPSQPHHSSSVQGYAHTDVGVRPRQSQHRSGALQGQHQAQPRAAPYATTPPHHRQLSQPQPGHAGTGGGGGLLLTEAALKQLPIGDRPSTYTRVGSELATNADWWRKPTTRASLVSYPKTAITERASVTPSEYALWESKMNDMEKSLRDEKQRRARFEEQLKELQELARSRGQLSTGAATAGTAKTTAGQQQQRQRQQHVGGSRMQ